MAAWVRKSASTLSDLDKLTKAVALTITGLALAGNGFAQSAYSPDSNAQASQATSVPVQFDFWKSAYAHQPISDITQLPTYKIVNSYGLLINDTDALHAINLVIQKQHGLYTEEELKRIEVGLHLREIGEMVQQRNAERTGKIRTTEMVGEDLHFGSAFDYLFSFVYATGHSRQSTEQLHNRLRQYFPGTRFFDNGLEWPRDFCKRINELSAKIGYRCNAFDEELGAVTQGCSMAAPTEFILADLSAYVYSVGRTAQLPSAIDGYSLIRNSSDNSIGFAADIFRSECQMVLVYKGTEPPAYSPNQSAVDFYKNFFLTDVPLALGNSSETMKKSVSRAVDALVTAENMCPECSFTLTGHSLGGAIAQMLGSKAGVRTVGFDAPGPGLLLATLGSSLEPLNGIHFTGSGRITNFRMHGDVVSLIGRAVGETCSIDQGTIGTALLEYHKIEFLIEHLHNSRAPFAVQPADGFPQALQCGQI